jgi:thiol-disulfide isomerase/thioredoxin
VKGRGPRQGWVAGPLAGILVLAGCASVAPTAPGSNSAGPGAAASTGQAASPTSVSPAPSYVSLAPIGVVPAPTMPAWFNVEMTDVNTGTRFRISDFTGKVVLVDTMAVWCPTCQGEMSQVAQLPAMIGPASSDLVRISLDVDPNEDATILKKFADKNKFDWIIAVAPIEVGRFLATHYDEQYLNPPTQPMLFVDRTGGVYGLPFGIKSALSIQKTLAQYLAP